eukprot:402437-Amphidinium_carterae.1
MVQLAKIPTALTLQDILQRLGSHSALKDSDLVEFEKHTCGSCALIVEVGATEELTAGILT